MLLRNIDKEIFMGLAVAGQDQVGSLPWKRSPAPANAILHWITQQSKNQGSVYGAYAPVLDAAASIFSSSRAELEDTAE